MAINPDISLGVQPVQLQNPLTLAMQGQSLRNSAIQGNMLTQAVQSNQAVGQAIQHNTDQNGNVNYGGVQKELSTNPFAQYNLQQATGNNITQQNQQTANQQAQFDLANKQLTYYKDQLAPFASNPNSTRADLIGAMATAVKEKMMTYNQMEAELADPSFPSSDGQAVQSYAAQHLNTATGALESLRNISPGGLMINTGDKTIIANGNNPLLTNKPYASPEATYQQQVTPAQLNTPIQVVGPNGQMQWTTQGHVIQQANQADNPWNGVTGKASQPTTAQTQPASASLPPGFAEATTTLAKGGADAAQQLTNSVQDAPTRITLLNKALDELRSGDVKTGIGTENVRNVTAAISNAAPGLAQAIGIDPTKIQSQDELNKLLTQYASRKSAEFGTGTDAKLAAALTGNANMHVSSLANDDILRYTIGIEKMNQAKNAAWQQYAAQGGPAAAANFNNWSTNWNAQNDPRIFMMDEMTPQQQQRMISNLSKPDFDKLKQQYNSAYQQGLVGH
ncbi:hypothetical protein [Tolumonas lignilytica]|uniref:hypothetical protein n=1 Tax=Tolumonas lignilytica TaxID=1283284 RepID=UPI00126910D3|nr:hypothetical protein [Tolumonas lignilytica]